MDQLLIQKGTTAVGRYALLGKELLLGRGGHVVLPSPFASRLHALLAWQGDKYIVTDLGSRNGTKVNGKSVEGDAVVKDGDIIEIGELRIICKFTGHPPQLLTPPVPTVDGLEDTQELRGGTVSSTLGTPTGAFSRVLTPNHPARVAAESSRIKRTQALSKVPEAPDAPPPAEAKLAAEAPPATPPAVEAGAAAPPAKPADAPPPAAGADPEKVAKADAARAAAEKAKADAEKARADAAAAPGDADKAKAADKAEKVAAALATKAEKLAEAAKPAATTPPGEAQAAKPADAPKAEEKPKPAKAGKDKGEKRESVGEDVKRAYEAYFVRLRRLVRKDVDPAKEQKPTQVDLTYHARPNPRKKALRRAWVAASLIAIGWVGVTLGRGERTILASATVSRGHQVFGNDCARCHVQPFGLAVPDTACLECHKAIVSGPDRAALAAVVSSHAPARQVWDAARSRPSFRSAPAEYLAGRWPSHHPTQAWTPACSDCHVEHGGGDVLAGVVADAHCAQCHADLGPNMKGAAAVLRPQGLSVKDITLHPEVAPLDSAAQGAPKGSSANLVVHEPGKPPRDKARLYLNHAKHLGAPLGAMESPERKAWIAATGRDHMTCADCHQLDAARALMEPIRFERHCASCHPLQVVALSQQERDTTALGAHAAGKPRAVPHGLQPGELVRLVRGMRLEEDVRDFYEKYAKAHPEERKQAAGRPPGPRRPGQGGGDTAPVVSEGGWVESRMKRWRDKGPGGLLEDLFTAETRGGCIKCHVLAGPGLSSDGALPAADERTKVLSGISSEWGADLVKGAAPPTIVPPAVPEVWLHNSRFSHDRHQTLRCDECHAGAATSSETHDVMLPRMSSCIACHSPQGGATGKCITCHDYHDRAGPQTDPGSLTSAELRRAGAIR